MEFTLIPQNRQLKFYFFCKKSIPNHPPLIFNGIVVERAKEQKHLGLILDPIISFEKHLNEKIIKAKKNVGIHNL